MHKIIQLYMNIQIFIDNIRKNMQEELCIMCKKIAYNIQMSARGIS